MRHPISPKRLLAAALEMLHLAPARSRRALFYVVTPDYTYMHSGVRCLHLLCHHLNRLGYRSYVNTPVTNSKLNTPFVDPPMLGQFRKDGIVDIVIYPEVIEGNPFNAERVVRYLLNRPGYFTGVGLETYGADDFFLHFADEFLPVGLKSQRLRIPLVDQEVYRMPEHPVTRDAFAVYVDRYQPDVTSFPAWITNQEFISRSAPRDPQSLASLYRRSRALITGERTGACMEAIHCGCPVIIIPNEKFDLKPLVEFYGGFGFCNGFDQNKLEHATNTLARARKTYEKRFRGLDKSIRAFAENACRKFGV